jgi:rhamnosyl/mannosyltransferase
MQGTNFQAVIVGAGPVERDLKAQAERLQLTNVHFVGAVADDDKVALLTLCRALTFPSHLRSEAFGISLLEGAMFGKPMLSTEIGTGTSYVNVHDETGLVVRHSDAAALREAMQTIWTDDDLTARFGANARKRFDALFTARKMVDSYVDLYGRLAKKTGTAEPGF